MGSMSRRWMYAIAAAVLSGLAIKPALAVGTDFTYQGQLVSGGSAISGLVDLQFSIWDAASGGTQQGATITRAGVSVSNGLVTQDLDFGAVFSAGANRWIQVAVRSPAGSGTYTTLTPRQAITPTPYAQFAANSPGSGLWQLVGGTAVTNTNAGFVGINRPTALTTSEVFGIQANTGASAYGGMYISTNSNTGLPFYGYYATGGPSAWTFLDGTSGRWGLVVNQAERLSVTSGGNVGIGTGSPSNRLTVTSAADTNTIVAIDSGATAPQSSTLRLNDRGTAFWSLNKTSSNDFAIREVGPSADRLYIAQGGNVGIGTASPSANLDVHNGDLRVSSNTSANVDLSVTSNGNGTVTCTDSTGFYIAWLGESQIAPAHGGQVVVGNQNGVLVGGLQVNSAGNCVLTATVKNFMVPNPDDPKTDIFYACVEGPEAAMYVRGTAYLSNGRATIQLPRHFAAMLASPQSMTVQLTSEDLNCHGLAVIRKGEESFDVGELLQGTSNGAFDWEVKAVRKGFENYQVIRPAGSLARPEAPGGAQ